MNEANTYITDVFGTDVFNDSVMRHRLPKKVYSALREVIEVGGELSLETADVIAHEMKEWALEKGATHYTHWFQPLTGTTAEKHDSFIGAPMPSGKVLMSLSGKQLIKGEPDASSFPSGGLRATFEARGYTIWDCTSPAFVRHDEGGATLCIPTAFCSYTGEALDQKTPLLRSMDAINKETLRLLKLLDKKNASKKVIPSVGAEQEYFIIDREKYLKRTDLVFTGRTLFGAMPPKGQELDDHYFGTLRPRIASYMRDVNWELWKLGVPAKTQHNEVAPAQHELAPVYEKANVAVDHNQIVMQTLKRVATRHGLRCLLHEKPFAGVNGSGKHNNWSLTTDDGMNLLDPGRTPHENTQFLLVLCCILRAVDKHYDLIRESAADIGNEARLGGNEAPPVISVFLGEQLEDVLDQLISTGSATSSKTGGMLQTGVNSLSDVTKDATDRNRTSPFAFTGNKFEFRMVGSRDSIAGANTVLNTIVAESFRDACDYIESFIDPELPEKENDKRVADAVHDLIKEYATKHRRIVFNGNGYSKEWEAEAVNRGLRIIPDMVDAIPALTTDKAIKLFKEFGVFTKVELESRAEVKYELYSKAVAIEARTMVQMAGKELLPAIMAYCGQLADSANAVRACGIDASVQEETLSELTSCLKEANASLKELDEAIRMAEQVPEGRERAVALRDTVVPAMEALRRPVDVAEGYVDRRAWPVPTYADLVFEV